MIRGSPLWTLVAVTAASLSGAPAPMARGDPPSPAAIREMLDSFRLAEAEQAARALLATAREADAAGSEAVTGALDLLVEALQQAGRSKEPEALELARRAVSLRQAALPADPASLVRSRILLAAVLRDAADFASARRELDEALALSKRALGAHHFETGLALAGLADLLRAMSDLRARSFYEQALEIFRRTSGREHPQMVRVVAGLAAQLRDAGEHAGARALFEQALAASRKTHGPDHPRTAAILNSEAILLEEMGEFSTALALYTDARRIFERTLGLDHPRSGAVHNNLALLHQAMGDYTRARDLLEESLTRTQAVHGPDHPQVARRLNNLGSLLVEMGDGAAARPLLERAVRIQAASFGEDSTQAAAARRHLARCLKAAGDPRGALDLLRAAIEPLAARLGPDHDDVLTAGSDMAESLIAAGEPLQARDMLLQVLARRRLASSERLETASVLSRLASVQLGLARTPEALPAAEEALAIRRLMLDRDHPRVAESLAQRALILLQVGRLPEGLDDALEAEAIGRRHLRLTMRSLAEGQALRYARVRASGLSLALSIAAAYGEPPPEKVRALWDSIIASRAIVLDEAAARRRLETEGPAALEVRLAGERLANLMVRGPGHASLERHFQMVESARREKEAAERAWARSTRAPGLDPPRPDPDLRRIVSSLPASAALVAYVRYMHLGAEPAGLAGSIRYAALVVSPRRPVPRLVPLATADAIETIVAAWRREAGQGLFESGREVSEAMASYRAVGSSLRSLVWDPIEPMIGDAKQVILVADGALHLVNFATLPDRRDDFLITSGPLLHSVSAERDLLPAAARSGRRDLLVMGGPDYDLAPEPAPADRLAGAHRAASNGSTLRPGLRAAPGACGDLGSTTFRTLPGSEAEAHEVATLWQRRYGDLGEASVLELTGAAATEAAFKSGAPGRRAVHLATHGFYLGGGCLEPPAGSRAVAGMAPAGDAPLAQVPADNPLLLSGLALAGANRRESAGVKEDDGILTGDEIAAIDLRGVEWTVLSGCDTAVGAIGDGEGVFGLRRAFRLAGARTLIMSLWPVDDQAARLWMRGLYEARLQEGLDTARAVRKASLGVKQEQERLGRPAHPFFWGGFVATGDLN